mgnify:CR=1 FL=1
MVRLPHPVLNNTQLDILCNIRYKGFNTVKLPIVFEVSKGKAGLQEALNDLCKKAEQSVTDGVNYIILSDRFVDDTHAAIPSLLAVSAVHHHLISVQKRVQTALIVESGEIREVMHAALLLGYGASAINPTWPSPYWMTGEERRCADELRNGREELYQGHPQGLVQDYEQDGHFDYPFLPGCKDF